MSRLYHDSPASSDLFGRRKDINCMCLYCCISQTIENANVFAKYSAEWSCQRSTMAVGHSRVVSAGRRLAQYCGRFWFSANQRRVPFVLRARRSLQTVKYSGAPNFTASGASGTPNLRVALVSGSLALGLWRRLACGIRLDDMIFF